jgi:hypothetical protein
VALNETSYLILKYIAFNYLFYEVPNDVRGKRESPGYKLINLANKSLLLRICKALVVKGGSFSFKDNYAFMPSHKRYTIDFEISACLSVIKDQLPI